MKNISQLFLFNFSLPSLVHFRQKYLKVIQEFYLYLYFFVSNILNQESLKINHFQVKSITEKMSSMYQGNFRFWDHIFIIKCHLFKIRRLQPHNYKIFVGIKHFKLAKVYNLKITIIYVGIPQRLQIFNLTMLKKFYDFLCYLVKQKSMYLQFNFINDSSSKLKCILNIFYLSPLGPLEKCLQRVRIYIYSFADNTQYISSKLLELRQQNLIRIQCQLVNSPIVDQTQILF